jgi:hypothetical protein
MIRLKTVFSRRFSQIIEQNFFVHNFRTALPSAVFGLRVPLPLSPLSLSLSLSLSFLFLSFSLSLFLSLSLLPFSLSLPLCSQCLMLSRHKKLAGVGCCLAVFVKLYWKTAVKYKILTLCNNSGLSAVKVFFFWGGGVDRRESATKRLSWRKKVDLDDLEQEYFETKKI